MTRVEGGTLILADPYHTHDEGRPIHHNVVAVSDHEGGKTATFRTPRAAEFWLWCIDQRVGGAERRTS